MLFVQEIRTTNQKWIPTGLTCTFEVKTIRIVNFVYTYIRPMIIVQFSKFGLCWCEDLENFLTDLGIFTKKQEIIFVIAEFTLQRKDASRTRVCVRFIPAEKYCVIPFSCEVIGNQILNIKGHSDKVTRKRKSFVFSTNEAKQGTGNLFFCLPKQSSFQLFHF